MKASYTTSCSKEKLKDIRSFIKECIQSLPIKDIEKSQIVLAIDEACANAIIHGNEGNLEKELNLDIDISGKRLKVEIYDIGSKDFDKLKHRKTEMKDLIKEKQKGGMGLKLIYAIMDDVFYYSKDSTHVCLLVKKLES